MKIALPDVCADWLFKIARNTCYKETLKHKELIDLSCVATTYCTSSYKHYLFVLVPIKTILECGISNFKLKDPQSEND